MEIMEKVLIIKLLTWKVKYAYTNKTEAIAHIESESTICLNKRASILFEYIYNPYSFFINFFK